MIVTETATVHDVQHDGMHYRRTESQDAVKWEKLVFWQVSQLAPERADELEFFFKRMKANSKH